VIDDRIILAAGFSEQHPGEGIQQGGFSRPICPGDASQLKGLKVNLDRLVVT